MSLIKVMYSEYIKNYQNLVIWKYIPIKGKIFEWTSPIRHTDAK